MTTLTEVSHYHPEAAHCDALYEVRDETVGLHAFIALHDLTRGPGYGGIRRRQYPSVRAAVQEVVDLAEQMTLKTAFAGLPAGGAKAVLIDTPGGPGNPGRELGPIYESLGRAIEELGGAFFAGPDVGTADLELTAVRAATRFVSGPDARLFESSARGVVDSCREALAFLGLDPAAFAGPTCVVAGVGSVGSLVARGLAELGWRLAISDIDALRAEQQALALGALILDPGEALTTETLVLSPCAIGPVVTSESLPRFRARIICGSANQQLEAELLAHELAERQILYVPDFAVNAGAVIEGVLRHTTPVGVDPEPRIEAALAAIGPRVRALLEMARAEDITPLEAALMQLA